MNDTSSKSRLRFPLIVLLLCGIVQAAIWLIPWSMRAYQVSASQAMIALTGLLLLFWLVCLLPIHWFFRLAVLLIILGIPPLVITIAHARGLISVHFTGDMGVIFTPPWRTSQDDVVAKNRQEVGRAEGTLQGTFTGLERTDFPEYRGRARDGLIVGPDLIRDWAKPPKELWRFPIGSGHSGFAVAGELIFTMEQRGQDEAVVAYDVASGKERWLASYPARFYDAAGDLGPRSTPTVRDGHVYSLGATGVLTCIKADTGELLWRADTLKDNANVNWGLSGSPLVTEVDGRRLVIVNPGVQSKTAPRGTLVAYDARNGAELWSEGDGQAGYSSPMVAKLGGKTQVLLFDGDGFAGYDLADKGNELWRMPWKTKENVNAAQPLALGGDRVLISSGYGVGSALLEIKELNGQWKVSEIWNNRRLRAKFSSPVVHEGFLYGLDDGVLVCLDAATGERPWQGKRYGHGQILLCQGLLLVSVEVDGEIALIEASPQRAKELGRFAAVDGRLWNPFALADGLLFVRNHREMACFDLTGTR